VNKCFICVLNALFAIGMVVEEISSASVGRSS